MTAVLEDITGQRTEIEDFGLVFLEELHRHGTTERHIEPLRKPPQVIAVQIISAVRSRRLESYMTFAVQVRGLKVHLGVCCLGAPRGCIMHPR